MTLHLPKFAVLSFLSLSVSAGLAVFSHAQPEGKLGLSQRQGCVPGQQTACSCASGGSGVQRCSADGISVGVCQGCPGEANSSPLECDLSGAWQFALSWQGSKCTYALNKTAFVVIPSERGFAIEDKSDGAPASATIKAEKTAKGCAVEIVQTIDPEGLVAGTKTVSGDKYIYRLTATNGVITGSGNYQNFQFVKKPACTGSFRVSGTRLAKEKR